MAMHNRQCHAGLIGASTGEDGIHWNPELFQALFPGLMAPFNPAVNPCFPSRSSGRLMAAIKTEDVPEYELLILSYDNDPLGQWLVPLVPCSELNHSPMNGLLCASSTALNHSILACCRVAMDL
jgi:hypothetical protein